jgi:hypothetical protein
MNTRKVFFGILTCGVLMIASCTTDNSDIYENGVDRTKITKGTDAVDRTKITKGTDAVDRTKISKGTDGKRKSN